MRREDIIGGQELVVKKEMDVFGIIIEKGENAKIDERYDGRDAVSIKIECKGIVGCSIEEVLEYFELKHKEEIVENHIEEDISEIKTIVHQGNTTVVVTKDGGVGISTCCEDDNYDKETGIKIATLKAKMCDLKNELDKFRH